MSEPASIQPDAKASADVVSQLVHRSGQTVAVAESLTSGSIAAHLGAAENASEWFRGGLVAYSSEVKFKVLGVDRGPVVTAECARQMARGAAELLDADFAVAVTGAGGPGPEEGHPQGTTFIAVHSATANDVAEHRFTGDPEHVVHAATSAALALLQALIERESTRSDPR